MKTIGLFTSVYFNNIGNGFIDLGAEATINLAKNADDRIVKVSQCANFAASMSKKFFLKENPIINFAWVHLMQKFSKKLHDRSYKTVNTIDVISAAKLFDFSYLIIPGCVLTVPFFTIYGELLKEKAKKGTKIIFLGASGNFYTDYEISFVTEYLNKIKPFAIMTRDSIAYNNYGHLSEHSYNGIDNVFFVNRLDIPNIKSNYGEYVVVNIEEPKHKELKKQLIKKLQSENKKIIFSNHKPYPYSKVGKLSREKVFISDYPLDYLLLYKNASIVYSDRVHACIPTLSFGNKAFLISDSPRKNLFKNVGLECITKKITQTNELGSKQKEQIEYLSHLLTQ